MVQAPPDDPGRRYDPSATDRGFVLVDCFTREGDELLLTALVARSTTIADAAAARAALADRSRRFAAYEREGGAPMPFLTAEDLRFARRLVTDDTFLWLGTQARLLGGAEYNGVRLMGDLVLGDRLVTLESYSRLVPQVPAPDGPEARTAWAVATAWVDAIRVANGLAPLTRHDLMGVAVEIPPPEGFVPLPADPDPVAEPMPWVPLTAFQRQRDGGARPVATVFTATFEGILFIETTRAQFEAARETAHARGASAERFPGVAAMAAVDGGTWRIEGGDTADSFVEVRIDKVPADPGAASDAPTVRLAGTAAIWVADRMLQLHMLSDDRVDGIMPILEATRMFKGWVAAVVAANGGA